MIHAQIQRIPFVAPTTREQQLAVTAWAARPAPDREALRETLQALGIVPLDKPAETAPARRPHGPVRDMPAVRTDAQGSAHLVAGVPRLPGGRGVTLTIGSQFSGAGMFDHAALNVFGGELSWYVENDPAAAKVMAYHHPGVPNLGDIATINWNAVPRVDVITSGSPCPDLSVAGNRKGMHDGTRSNLWVESRESIEIIKPALFIWENVRGAYSACAHSDLGDCPRCVGADPEGKHRPVLRAVGRVLGDLSNLRYDARWYGLKASDVGAAHGRPRIFVFAAPDGTTLDDLIDRLGLADVAPPVSVPAGDKYLTLLPTPKARDNRAASPSDYRRNSPALNAVVLDLLPTPTANLGSSGGSQHPDKRRGGGHSASLQDVVEHLLPTPTARDAEGSGGSTPYNITLTDATVRTAMGTIPNPRHMLPTPRATRGGSATETVNLLPTPRATDGTKGGPNQRGSSGDLMLPSAVAHLLPPTTADAADGRWGKYEAAIRRQEWVFGRPAPEPVKLSARGARLSPHFDEWLMGMPAGWLCDPAIDLKDNDVLKICGNSVVNQQAEAAMRQWAYDVCAEAESNAATEQTA